MPARRAVPLTQSRVSVPREAGTGVGTSAGCPRGPRGPARARPRPYGPAPPPRAPLALRGRRIFSLEPTATLPRRGPSGHVRPQPTARRLQRRPGPRPSVSSPWEAGARSPTWTLAGRSGAGAAGAPPAGRVAADSALSSGPRLEGMTLGWKGPQREAPAAAASEKRKTRASEREKGA